ncbi:MAG TPA: S8 family serine peptidase [Bacteroidales bacterium]|nr:S8 family serine peptidase [Bacteroidales bacterium]
MIRWLNLLLFILASAVHLNAQYPAGRYWVRLSDKNHNAFSLEHPEEFLSQRALQRRKDQNIPVEFNDLPVSRFYMDSLIGLGIPVVNTSKWFNSFTTGDIDNTQVSILLGLPFVNQIQYVRPAVIQNKTTLPGGQLSDLSESFNYGFGGGQITIHHGEQLHKMGYTGKGIHIAIIDAGFNQADLLPAFYNLWDNNQILGFRDFVEPGSDIFEAHGHGTYVLSVMGSYAPGIMIGTAPDASFWLLRSEDTGSEYLIEEDNWVSAAEFADSAGADVINTSLGYFTFDDSTQDHTYQDMDGNTTRISIAADIAASKGMLLVNSAGNQGNKEWKYISAPADADSILTIGAVEYSGIIAPFSSLGPTSDGQIKPDVCAVGWGTYMYLPNGALTQGNGTSLSSPVIAGLSACLWQANRQATNMQLLEAVQQSSDRFENPDTIYGYGIPDFYQANLLLKTNYRSKSDTTDIIHIFPNPFRYETYLSFESEDDAEAIISASNPAGNLVIDFKMPVNKGYNLILIDEFSELSRGIYIVMVQCDEKLLYQKIIKL